MTIPLIELKIESIRDEAPGARSFVLSRTDGKPLVYQAGQFLTFVFPHKLNDNRRSYSISSTPSLGEPLTITVKRIDNGEFSRYLFDYCQEGSSLFTIGPAGFFVLPPVPRQVSSFVFYAAGSGITPILPLVKTLLYNYPDVSVWLIYSNHSVQNTIFLREIRALEEQYPQLRVEWLFSNNKNLLRARLTKQLVADQAHNEVDRRTSLFYLCGPHEYMQMITITLLREGVSQEQIRKEIFDSIKTVVRDLPPDQSAHNVWVSYMGERFELRVQYPETILQAARSRGILLPYSCDAGKCGTCAATCTKGEVWMSYNEVLLDKELRAGRVLTCTGYPIHGDVELVYPTPQG